ncbi:hypothetical protein [Aquibacillus rhizosphaerae]|uniref:Uncharacterized protein n=1 Tax=Aquibacillus rhizosphaerae TaxID=3051431 RepID=A0ABT7LBK9_9BACI|nr:hypothetical protein [Aquibacillus sp. LR5S19]MDL4843253.1 hypothetical protein [Aquibacillus sp. LR5S19]
MKSKLILMLLMTVLVLSACGKEEQGESMTLLDQENSEIAFPQDKPTLFFFITTYT